MYCHKNGLLFIHFSRSFKPFMSSSFQMSSGTCLAHSGMEEEAMKNPDIACFISSTASALPSNIERDWERDKE